ARAIRRAVLRDRFHSRRWRTPMARRTLKGSSPRALRPVSPEWKRRERGGRSARGRLRWTWVACRAPSPRRPAAGGGGAGNENRRRGASRGATKMAVSTKAGRSEKNERVIVAMSGGVDSSFAAAPPAEAGLA